MTPDAGYLSRPDLAPARFLQRAGQWDAALGLILELDDPEAAALRADMLVDRHVWQLDGAAEAAAAITAISADDPALTALLSGVLEYWRRLFNPSSRPVIDGDPVSLFAGATPTRRLQGWATFWHAVSTEKLLNDQGAATAGYRRAREAAKEDRLLESYVVRHQGFQLLESQQGRDRGIALLRRSLQLRAACGARPHVAAAQAALAEALSPSAEAEDLSEIAADTARALRIRWLIPGPPSDAE